MSIFTKLWDLIKVLLPVLKSAAQKAIAQLPDDKKQQLINISKMTEVLKQAWPKVQVGVITTSEAIKLIEDNTGFTPDVIEAYITSYFKDKGVSVTSLTDGLTALFNDASQRTETGLKSLWHGFTTLVSEFASAIDWETLLMGVIEEIYQAEVKGKINI